MNSMSAALNIYKKQVQTYDRKIDLLSYSEKESQSNDTLLPFVELSNVHNSDRSSNHGSQETKKELKM